MPGGVRRLSRGRDPKRFFEMAHGSAAEIRGVLDVADAWGWPIDSGAARVILDREIGFQTARKPPSTASSTPARYWLSLEARNTTAFATSSSAPSRVSGIICLIATSMPGLLAM